MNENKMPELAQAIKTTRLQKGWTQQELADKANISRSSLAKYELGLRKLSEEQTNLLLDCLLEVKKEAPLEGIIDYLTIHFFSTDYENLVTEILGVSMKYMIYYENTQLGYLGRYNLLNAIDIRISNDAIKGTLIELKGKGCRLLSGWMRARKETWQVFFKKVLHHGGNFTRIDISMNDYVGMLDLPKLARQIKKGHYETNFKRGDIYEGKDLAHRETQGTTLYFGSTKSQMHFCFYQKNYEQQRKNGIPLEDYPIINRYELRFRHEKAQGLAYQLIGNKPFETIIFELINPMICFYDRLPDEPHVKVDRDWANFIGNHGELTISLNSNPMTLEKSMRWLIHGVAPTMKMIDSIGKIYHVDLIGMIIDSGELSEKTQKILNAVTEQPEWFQEEIDIYTNELQDKQKKQSTAALECATVLRPRQVEYTTFCSASQDTKEEVQ